MMDNNFQIDLSIEGIHCNLYTLKQQANQLHYRYSGTLSEECLELTLCHKTSLSLALESRANITFSSTIISRELSYIITAIKGPKISHQHFETTLTLERPTALLKKKTCSRVFIDETPTAIAKVLARPLFPEFDLKKDYSQTVSFIQNNETNFSALLRFLSQMNWNIRWGSQPLSSLLTFSDTYRHHTTIPLLDDISLHPNWNLESTSLAFSQYEPNSPENPKNSTLVKKNPTPSYGQRHQVIAHQQLTGAKQARASVLDLHRETYHFTQATGHCFVGDIIKVSSEVNQLFFVIQLEKAWNDDSSKVTVTPFTRDSYYPLTEQIEPYHPLTSAKVALSPHSQSQLSSKGAYHLSHQLDNLIFESNEPQTAPLSQPVTHLGQEGGFHFPLQENTLVYCGFNHGDRLDPIIIGARFKPQQNPITSLNPNHAHLTHFSGHGLYWQDEPEKSELKVSLQDTASISLLQEEQGDEISLSVDDGSFEANSQKSLSYQSDEQINIQSKELYQTISEKESQISLEESFHWRAEQGLSFKSNHQIEWHATHHQLAFTQKNSAWRSQNLTIKSEDTLVINCQKGLQMNAKSKFNLNPSEQLIIQHPLAKIIIKNHQILLQSATCIHANTAGFSATPPLTYPAGK